MKPIVDFIKKEVVLVASFILAVISMCLVPPKPAYLEYIDWRTLGLLFGLMLVMVGFQKAGVFQYVGNCFLKRVTGKRGVQGILVFLCFFFAMLITNDVALLTFVPFSIVVLVMAKWEEEICFTVILQTIGANLGSMLTPLGNPQNLYMYAETGMSFFDFVKIMFPYALVAGLFLLSLVFFFPKAKQVNDTKEILQVEVPATKDVMFYFILFVVCLLAVINVIPWYVMALVVGISVLIKDRSCLKKVDYSLLFTFVFLFVFVGNLGNLEALMNFFQGIPKTNICLISVALSQVISNVPATLLLCEIYGCSKDIMIGVNLGGLGTLIASMASLISYKFVAREYPHVKGKYFGLFTLWNVIFLAVLYGVYVILN